MIHFSIYHLIVGAVILDQSSEFNDDNGSHQQDLSAFNNEKGGEMSGDWRYYPHFAAEENGFNSDDEENVSESHKLLDNNNNSKASSSCGNDNTKCQAAVAPVSSVISKGECLKAKQKVIIRTKKCCTHVYVVRRCHLTNTGGQNSKIVKIYLYLRQSKRLMIRRNSWNRLKSFWFVCAYDGIYSFD